jgi:predicted nucleic acid-binding protein
MAFLIDTNVLSEIRKKSADPSVLQWQSQHDLVDCWVSVLTLMEIKTGIARIRNTDASFADKLDAWYRGEVLKAYAGRILPVTLPVCEVRATLSCERTLPALDALIAATAKHFKLKMVTRNIKDFEHFGIELINPWAHPSN